MRNNAGLAANVLKHTLHAPLEQVERHPDGTWPNIEFTKYTKRSDTTPTIIPCRLMTQSVCCQTNLEVVMKHTLQFSVIRQCMLAHKTRV